MKVRRFVSPFVRAVELTEPLTVTITAAGTAEYERDDGAVDEVVVITVKELDQRIRAGKQGVRQLIKLFGTDDTDEWLGKRVQIFCDLSVTNPKGGQGGVRFREAT